MPRRLTSNRDGRGSEAHSNPVLLSFFAMQCCHVCREPFPRILREDRPHSPPLAEFPNH